MILLLDTSTQKCKLSIIDGDWRQDTEWQADRDLAKHLLKFLFETLQKYGKSWSDVTAIGVFQGPGSFTGLRIGLTVMNTFADANHIPIVGGQGNNWQDEALAKLSDGMNEKIVLPHYGGEANISAPKK